MWSDLACWLYFADGVSPGVEPRILGVLVFNLDIAKVFCRVALPICNPLHVNELCFLPTLGFWWAVWLLPMGGHIKWFNLCSSVKHLCQNWLASWISSSMNCLFCRDSYLFLLISQSSLYIPDMLLLSHMNITDFSSDLPFHLIPGVFYFSKSWKMGCRQIYPSFFLVCTFLSCLWILSCLKVIEIVS